MDTECSQGTGKWIVANEIWEKKGGKKAKAMPDAAQPCAAPVLCQVFGGKNSEKRKIQSRGQAAVQRLADGVAALHGFGAFSPFFTIFSGVSGSATCGLTLPPRLAPRVAFWGKKAKKKRLLGEPKCCQHRGQLRPGHDPAHGPVLGGFAAF